VDRDDLPDQGAGHFAETIRAIEERDPSIRVEALVPDFQGDLNLVGTVLEAGPDVFAHNVETVDRLQWPVRDRRAGYEQSLSVLEYAADSDAFVKTSLMLGVGEYAHEVYRTLSDLKERGVDIVTVGQYLQPSRSHLEVFDYVHPHVFETWRRVAEEEFGFAYCASGPLVRSSYRAGGSRRRPGRPRCDGPRGATDRAARRVRPPPDDPRPYPSRPSAREPPAIERLLATAPQIDLQVPHSRQYHSTPVTSRYLTPNVTAL
jgi:lipoate synthase